jgi:hypothetical protein
MEADFIEIFELFRSILGRCKEPILSDDDINICKKLQTKVGISLTLMKQIDFGDVVVQTFMADLDVFSTVLDNLTELFLIQSIPSLDTFQEIRASLVQSVTKLIFSSKEFYLTKVGMLIL